MKHIIYRYYKTYFKNSSLLFGLIIIILGVYLFAISVKNLDYSDFSSYMGQVNLAYISTSFFVFLAFMLYMLSALKNSEQNISEIKEGTIKFLLIKPLLRHEILLAKYIANIFGTFSIFFIASLSYTALCALYIEDFDIALEFYVIFFEMLLIALVFIIFMQSFALALSLLIKKEALYMAFMVIILLAVFLFIPLFRVINEDGYLKYHLAIFDISYHFLYMAKTVFAIPLDTNLNLMSSISGLYNYGSIDPDFFNSLSTGMIETHYVSLLPTILSYLFLSIALMGFALFRFKRIDIS